MAFPSLGLSFPSVHGSGFGWQHLLGPFQLRNPNLAAVSTRRLSQPPGLSTWSCPRYGLNYVPLKS